ncbi:DNA polymerase-3 subunit epsilon [Bowdeniella nasicola]|uniref:DNA polymerase-3 subunit epsilon n=1 Tax=Bowdeniella nasicola TaxID=208480 RepID=A0A1H3Y8G6_9ACTO|nr:exonuclease domain-containing protein [Bowdeniella nasicola]SEA07926.1 DNA polymerase-3 subunit epsilon [Bowdeniella nasicola]
MSGFCVIDFETTGFAAEHTDRIVEVGVVLLDRTGAKEDSFTTLINPKRDVGASHIHRITAAEVLDAPEFSEICDDLLDMVTGRVVVAHNAVFDMRFLHAELSRAGYSLSERPHAVCSMQWSRHVLGTSKLEHCCEALGIHLTNAHSALGDAAATSQLLTSLIPYTMLDPRWGDDLERSQRYAWPRSLGRRATRIARRHSGKPPAPNSWMAELVSHAVVAADETDEAAYLDLLSKALLDTSISTTEGRALASLARVSGLTRERVTELHRRFLRSLATEAWTDGVITPDEFADLTAAAQCMGLSASDVTQALQAAKTSAEQPRTTLLSEGDRVVFTGTLSRPREDWITEIRHHGLTTGGISKSTRVVVAADPDSLSGKARTARNYGVPVISEAAFRKHLAQYTAARG